MKAQMTANLIVTIVMILWTTLSLHAAGNSDKTNANNTNTDTQTVHVSAIATPVQSAQKQMLTLNFGSQLNNAQLSLCNTLGEVVKTITNINGQEAYIDRSELSNETYYFQLTQTNRPIIIGKLVVQ